MCHAQYAHYLNKPINDNTCKLVIEYVPFTLVEKRFGL